MSTSSGSRGAHPGQLRLIIGNFELDFDDGEVRYKTSVDVEGTRLTIPLIRQVVNLNVVTMDRYWPAIQHTLAGLAPAEALRRAEAAADKPPPRLDGVAANRSGPPGFGARLEVIDDRSQLRSRGDVTQSPDEDWHAALTAGDPIPADAILDRLVHNPQRVPLCGTRMRRRQPPPPEDRRLG